MMTGQPIQRVVILGGGTAGWMTAAYLQHFLKPLGVQITLIESPTIGTIGVGEATVPRMVTFLRTLKIDEAKFLRACSGTFKLAIKFVNWQNPGSTYWHPFGPCGGDIDGVHLFYLWAKAVREGKLDVPYEAFSLQGLAATLDKAPSTLQAMSPILQSGGYAYHLDAGAFADMLKGIATGSGVKHFYDDLATVNRDESGNITSLSMATGSTHTGDFFIDCTGFRGLLIEKALNDPWIDWSNQLLCDRALAVPMQRDPHMAPYTRATALSAGWMWQIPLSHRVGCGYVYSSQFIDEEQATAELLKRANPENRPHGDIRPIQIRVGRRTEFWKHNCVSIGLASGFLEPLESTGILFIQLALEYLLELFPDQSPSTAVRQTYNQRMGETYEEIKDFIVLHYLLSGKQRGPFWDAAQHVPIPASLQAMWALYQETGMIPPERTRVFSETSYHFIAAGNHALPRRSPIWAERFDTQQVLEIFRQIQAQNNAVVRELPSHADFVKAIHRPEV